MDKQLTIDQLKQDRLALERQLFMLQGTLQYIDKKITDLNKEDADDNKPK